MAVVRSNTLSVETLGIQRLIQGAKPDVYRQAYNDVWQGRIRFDSVAPRVARFWVREGREEEHYVEIRLTDGSLSLACDCPHAARRTAYLCRHMLGAALKLNEHLRAHPFVTWESVLEKAIAEAPPRSNGTGPRSMLVFSLQEGHHAWRIIPYSLPFTPFREDLRDDAAAVAAIIKRERIAYQAKMVRNMTGMRRFVNASDEVARAAYMLALSQMSYYFEDDAVLTFGHALPQIAHMPIFLGTQTEPLKKPLRVSAEAVAPDLHIDAGPEGVRLRLNLTRAGETLPLERGKAQVVSSDPLWLLADNALFPVDAAAGPLAALFEAPEIVVPKEDEAEFLDRYFIPLAQRMPVSGEGITWEDVQAPPEKRVYLDETEEGELLATLRFAYGGWELPFEKDAPELSIQRHPGTMALVRIRRELSTEQAAHEAMPGFGLKRGREPGEFLLRARVKPVDFLLHQVPRLAEAGYVVFGEEALTTARVNRNHPTLSFSVSSGIDWFDVAAVVNFGDLEVSLKDVRRAVRRRERYIQLSDGTIGALPEEWLSRYRRLFGLGEETEAGLRLSAGHVTLIDQLLGEADRFQADEEFQSRRDRLRDFASIQPRELPKGLQADLRHYQKAGFDWLHFLHEYGFGGCLADDMGTGKTVQALSFLLSLREDGHAQAPDLIVLPRSLLFNWQREAARFTPGLKILFYADKDRTTDLSDFDQYDLVLTTYGIMRLDIEKLRKRRFHYVLLDESQAIKNPLSQTAKAARLLQADHRLVLTGTPVENSTMELWSQFAFLNPGLLGSLDYFREEYTGPIERQQDADAADFLRKMVYPFILRRTKDQVAPELPERTERVLVTDMEPAQRKLYEKTRDYYRAQVLGILDDTGINDARMKVLEGLLRLRQISNDPRLVDKRFRGGSGKFELLLETLETLREEGHKALVFSQFVQMLTLVREALDKRGVPYMYLDGKTKDRQAPVDAFQGDPKIPFFLVSLKAGGVGLNLTAADYVIHIDPWWNPAVEMQASDRTHRIGQEKPVFVYKLIARDSVEEKILQLQERKRDLVEQLITTERSFFKSLTRTDVETLFS